MRDAGGPARVHVAARAARGHDVVGQVPPDAAAKPTVDIGRYLPTLVVNLANELWRVGSAHYRARFGVGMVEVRLLLHLGRADGQIASEIGAAVRLHESAVSRSLKVLREAGMIRIARDGPRRVVALTPKGRTLQARIAEDSLARQAWLLDGMAPAEVETLSATLRRLTERVSRLNAAPEAAG